MRKLIRTKGLSKKEWLSYRRLGIGGSDASVILGINPYRSILKLWEEKTGRVEADLTESEIQHFGHVMEDIVKKEFERRTGLKVRRSNFILQSDDHPFMIADIDGVLKDEDGEHCIFEAKTASEFKKKEWEGGVPKEYFAQVQHYLTVTGYKKAYVAAVVGGNSFFYYVVHRSEAYIRDLIKKEGSFWELVLSGIPPLPDGAEATSAYLAERYKKTIPDGIELPDSAEELLRQYDRISSEAEKTSKEKTEIINRLKEMLGEHEIGYSGARTVSWKKISKSSLDTKKVKEKLGDDYEDYLTESSYRRFMIA